MSTDNESIATNEPTASDPIVTDESAVDGTETQTEEVKAEETPEEKLKPEKTPEQREIDRLRRGIARKTQQLAEARAGLTRQPIAGNNGAQADDSEALSLTKAQLRELVTSEAEKLAPAIQQQRAEVERRTSVVQSLTSTWGQEKFDEIASDLDDAFGGLSDSGGAPKPAIEAVFEADDPAKVIEWLADQDNAEEAERISKMTAAQAGKAIAKLEARLAAETPKPKPKVSSIPAPLEPVRGQGRIDNSLPQDTDSTEVWLEKERNRMKAKGITRYG